MVRPHSPYDAYRLLHFGRRAGDTLDHHRLGVGRVACCIRRWALTSLIFSGNFAAPNTSSLIEVDQALESMRDAGFDFEAASGEPIDNSVEATATTIRVQPKYSKHGK